MLKFLWAIWKATRYKRSSGVDFDAQFKLDKMEYLQNTEFGDCLRYFYIVHGVIDSHLKAVLEIGVGSGIVKNCLQPIVERYVTMDIDNKLAPDILVDVREFRPESKNEFDCIIISEVIEHIPFVEVEMVCRNLLAYLVPGGRVFVTTPHQRYAVLFVIKTIEPYVFTIPRRKIPIDPHHHWEIGDGKIKQRHIESIFKSVGFKIERYEKLLGEDFWVLLKL